MGMEDFNSGVANCRTSAFRRQLGVNKVTLRAGDRREVTVANDTATLYAHLRDALTGWCPSTGVMLMLPQHDDFSKLRRWYEAAAIVGAAGLLLRQIVFLAATPSVRTWWTLPVVIAGLLTADLLSGIVHWFADTWGRETMPILGRRLLRPFRVHHVNPDDFLRRGFLDVNGDVAMIVMPLMIAVFWIPVDTTGGTLCRVFIVSFCAAGLPTNQVHQWAHMRPAPRLITCLQRAGLILSAEDHMKHHRSPYVAYYCIATGWLNHPLTRIDFFRSAERLVTKLTGLVPREDDHQFEARVISRVAAAHPIEEHSHE